jgi:hypothetical protein
MKHFVHLIFCILPFLLQCSKVTERVKSDQPYYTELTPQTVETELVILNFSVNEVAFDELFENYEEGLEIDGELYVYRNGSPVIADVEIEMEIKGSHSAKFPLKQLGITFEDSCFDNSGRDLINPLLILPHHQLDSIHAFRLRNSGNDFYKTMVKDLAYTQLAIDAGLNVDLTYGEQALVFINSDFYGVMEMRTEGNTKGIAGLYEVQRSQVSLGKITNPGTIHYKSGDHARLELFVSCIANGEREWLMNNIDVESFVDYVIFQSFIANYDWPYNNVRFYCIDNQPFRFVIYDLDWCNTVSIEQDPMFFIDPEKENIITDLFLLLYHDPFFKDQFDERYEAVIAMPELQPSHFNARVDYFSSKITDEMDWQIDKYGAPRSMLDWFRELDLLKQHYQRRYDRF